MNSDDNMVTMYPSDAKKTDLEETQVFDSKFRRQRNYKKIRNEQKRRDGIEEIKIKNSTRYNESDERVDTK